MESFRYLSGKRVISWIMNVLPPIVVAPVIMVIGLALAPTAIRMASTIKWNGESEPVYSLLHFSAALVTLGSAIICLIVL